MKDQWKNILLALSLTVIVILAIFLVRCEMNTNKSVDNFCNCFGPQTNSVGDEKPFYHAEVCYDPQSIVKLYENGYFQDTFAGV